MYEVENIFFGGQPWHIDSNFPVSAHSDSLGTLIRRRRGSTPLSAPSKHQYNFVSDFTSIRSIIFQRNFPNFFFLSLPLPNSFHFSVPKSCLENPLWLAWKWPSAATGCRATCALEIRERLLIHPLRRCDFTATTWRRKINTTTTSRREERDRNHCRRVAAARKENSILARQKVETVHFCNFCHKMENNNLFFLLLGRFLKTNAYTMNREAEVLENKCNQYKHKYFS